jgi:sulfide:quinone oxidoreductase
LAIEIVVLGDGTGGVVAANLLNKAARKNNLQLNIKVIGNSPVHTYQPGLLFLPFQKRGYRTPTDIQRETARFIGSGIEYVRARIEALDGAARTVTTENGSYRYDWAIIALGCRTNVDDIPGLRDVWGTKAHGFYTPDSAMRLAKALEDFQGGDLVVDVADMPIKCPVAPVEFVYLADEYLHKRGIRSKTRLTFVTPLSGAFTKPVCNEALMGMLVEKDINVVPHASLGVVSERSLACPDGQEVPYDLLVTIPPHEGSDVIEEAGLGDGLGFGLTDRFTLKSRKTDRVFLLGDNTNVPTSKAGSVAHFQAEVVVHNLLREIGGQEAEPIADGHANCFIETGFSKAVLIDFNYDTQPVPGTFPVPGLGPLSLLKETYLNHLGKLAFKHVYWRMLLPGRPLPLVTSRMSRAGKRLEILEKHA